MPTPSGGRLALLTPLTGDTFIDSVLYGVDWNTYYYRYAPADTVLTYSFPTATSTWSASIADYGVPGSSFNGEPWRPGYAALTPAQIAGVRSAAMTWEHYAHIQMSETGELPDYVGDIRFAQTSAPLNDFVAWAYSPGAAARAGDVWLNASSPDMQNVTVGSYGYLVLLHEIGHVWGLKHPFDITAYNATLLPGAYDSVDLTIMSYNAAPGLSLSDWTLSYYPTTPSALDILAIQYLYGPNTTYHQASDAYVYHQGQNYSETIWDPSGIDTIYWDAATQGAVIDLTPGSWSELGNPIIYTAPWGEQFEASQTVATAFGVVIENAIAGGGNDTLIGNDAANVLTGGGGNDTILGGAGNDWIEGDESHFPNPTLGVAGNDYLQGDDGDDTFLAGAGDDTVHGNAGNDLIVGDSGNDVLYGDEGNDAVDGRAGGDVLFGGIGVDILFGDADGDTIYGGDGNDVIMGERGEDSLVGALDVIYGEAGNDLLDGGAGNDWIFGGDGNDVITGDYGSDYIVAGPGADIMLGSGASAYGPATIGNDLFVFTQMADAGDQIWGFDTRPGDTDGIDIRAVFDQAGYSGTTPRTDGFLYLFQNQSNTDIYVDMNGPAGGVNLMPVLTLHDVVATSVTDSVFLFQ